MPSKGFDPWSLWHAPSNGLSIVDVHHHTKPSGPKKPSDLVLISGQTIQSTRHRIGVLDMKYICFSLIVVSRSNCDNFAYGWSVPERNNVCYRRYVSSHITSTNIGTNENVFCQQTTNIDALENKASTVLKFPYISYIWKFRN
jgi:hypothetical protein